MNKYPAVAPSPRSEEKDDELARMDFRPNGEDGHRWNLGHGTRRINPVFDIDNWNTAKVQE